MVFNGKPLYQCFNGEAVFFEWEKKSMKSACGSTLTWQLKKWNCLFIAFFFSLFSAVNLQTSVSSSPERAERCIRSYSFFFPPLQKVTWKYKGHKS